MVELTTTTRIDDQGRLYLAKPIREALGIDGEAALVELDVRPVDAASKLADETGRDREDFAADDKDLPELDDLKEDNDA